MSTNPGASGLWLPADKVVQACDAQIRNIRGHREKRKNARIKELMDRKPWFFSPYTEEQARKIVESDPVHEFEYGLQFTECENIVRLARVAAAMGEKIYITTEDFRNIRYEYEQIP